MIAHFATGFGGVVLWTGVPPGPVFFGGDILRRLISFFMALLVCAFVFIPNLTCKAVVNPSFIYSAMYSFLLSSGYKFQTGYAETSSDVTDMMADLYDQYIADDNSDALGIQDYENLISLSQLGQFVFGYAAVQQLQDFAAWIKSKFNLVDGDSNFITVIGNSGSYDFDEYSLDDYSFLSIFSSNYASMPVSAINYSISNYVSYSSTSGSVERTYYIEGGKRQFFVQINDPSNPYIFLVSTSDIPFSGYRVTEVDYGNPGTDVQVSKSSYSVSTPSAVINGSNVYVITTTVYNPNLPLVGPINALNMNTNSVNSVKAIEQFGYVALYGDLSSVLVSSLGLRIASTVIDRASEVGQNESLLVDMGLSAGSSVADAIQRVTSGVADNTISVSIPDTSVVADSVIDTPVQQYPDVDSLGLPDLGLALTSRFPFSIPWDISAIYSTLSHASVPPVKSFQLIPQSVLDRWHINADTTITIDLTEEKYAVLLAIIHWSSIVGFCFALAVMTKRYIWTTGG